MGKKRMIDMDGLCFDIEITSLGIDACFFYVRLWTLAEDWGGIEIEPRSLLLHMGGLQQDYQLDRVEGLMQEFVQMDKIVLYEVDGKTYGWLKNFIKHQKLNLPAPSKLPLPEWVKWHPKTGENKSQKYEFLDIPNDRSTTVKTGKSEPKQQETITTVQRPYNKKNRKEENRKEEKINTSPEPQKAGSVTPPEEDNKSNRELAPISFNYSSYKFVGINPDDIEAWKKAYPDVDVLQEIRQMEQWCIANRNKISLRQGKGKQGLRRTITSWLNRTQKEYDASLNLQKAKKATGSRGGTAPTQSEASGKPYKPNEELLDPKMKELKEKLEGKRVENSTC